MFEETLLESSPRQTSALGRIRQLFSAFAGTLFFESMLIGGLVLVPLIYTQALPTKLLIGEIHFAPPPGPPPAPIKVEGAQPAPHRTVDIFTAPAIIPPGIARIVDPPRDSREGNGLVAAVPGVPDGLGEGDGSTPGGDPWRRELPPPPPAVHPTQHPSIVRLSSGVIAAKAVYQPKPVYPPLAVMARIQGRVMLEAIIGKDGSVQDLKVLGGHPMLVRAALEAVKAWRYEPTFLDDEPVNVLTEIDVNFNLSD